jgi:hypothetical protein
MSLKETIKNQIIEIEKADLNALKEMYASHLEASDLEDESTPDPEDFSQKTQSQESALGLEVRINRQKQMIDSFLNLDFGPKEKVEPGSLVLTDTLNFFIGITANMFDYEGKKYIGLNTEAPIYAALEGAKAGDAVEFNGQKYSIKEVL